MVYLKDFVKKMTVMDGRTSAKDFWMTMLWMILFNILFSIVVATIGLIIKLPTLLAGAMIVLNIIIMFATLSMQVRRLHDTNKSAWFLLINFVPVIGQIVMFVFYCTPGTQGPNMYGEPTNL